jgi:tetratricopeptide (TPR) repeat protein
LDSKGSAGPPKSAFPAFVFDDEPLESILYGEPGTGPTPACLFAPAEPFVSAIMEAFVQGNVEEALRRMAELLASGDPVSISDLIGFTLLIGSFIPQVPCPIVEDRGISYDTLLEPLFTAGVGRNNSILVEKAGTALHRYYEGRGRFTDAMRIVGVLLEKARETGNRHDEPVFLNNLGYDYLLEGDFDRAMACFQSALNLFPRHGSYLERMNARLNMLLALYECSGGRYNRSFERRASRLLSSLGNDWRRRKALILLARIAEGSGDLEKAAQLVRQAVDASEGIPTKHRLEDLAYLERLEGARRENGG